MRAEIKELTEIICGTEGVYEQEDLVHTFNRCQSNWDYAESMFQVAFHQQAMDHITDPPSRDYKGLIEAFGKLKDCCQLWETTLTEMTDGK